MRILNEVLVNDLSEIRKELKIVFGQDFCRRMYDHPIYERLQKKLDEHYRCLDLIWTDPFCKHNGFDESNTLHVDCDQAKVQTCLKNSIVVAEYVEKDVLTQR